MVGEGGVPAVEGSDNDNGKDGDSFAPHDVGPLPAASPQACSDVRWHSLGQRAAAFEDALELPGGSFTVLQEWCVLDDEGKLFSRRTAEAIIDEGCKSPYDPFNDYERLSIQFSYVAMFRCTILLTVHPTLHCWVDLSLSSHLCSTPTSPPAAWCGRLHPWLPS